jgi:hypothetical protein
LTLLLIFLLFAAAPVNARNIISREDPLVTGVGTKGTNLPVTDRPASAVAPKRKITSTGPETLLLQEDVSTSGAAEIPPINSRSVDAAANEGDTGTNLSRRSPTDHDLQLEVQQRVRYHPRSLITTDSMLTLGKPASASEALSSCANAATVTARTNSHKALWLLDPCPWGVTGGNGQVTMSYSGSGSVTTTVNYSSLNQAAVNGYPFIFYGTDQYGDPPINGQPPRFQRRLSSLKRLITDVAYSLSSIKTPGDLDVGYDEWIVPNRGSSKTIEIFVMTYVNFADNAPGHFVQTFMEPAVIDGVPADMPFNEYSNGSGIGGFVVFEPLTNIISGEVRFNLLDFLEEGVRISGVNTRWWSTGVEFGTEFGDASDVDYRLTVTKFDIEQTLLK